MQVVDFSDKRFFRALGAIAARAGVGIDDVYDYAADEMVRRLGRGEIATPSLLVGVARQGAAWGRLRPGGRHEVPMPTDEDGIPIDIPAPEPEEEPDDLPPHLEAVARLVRSGGTADLATAVGVSQRRVQQVLAARDRSTLEGWGWLLLQREQQGDLLGVV